MMMANATHAVLSAKPAAAPRARATVSGARAAVPACRPAAFGAPARLSRAAGRGALAVRAAVADDKKFARPGAVEVKEGKGGLEMVRARRSQRPERPCRAARGRWRAQHAAALPFGRASARKRR